MAARRDGGGEPGGDRGYLLQHAGERLVSRLGRPPVGFEVALAASQ